MCIRGSADINRFGIRAYADPRRAQCHALLLLVHAFGIDAHIASLREVEERVPFILIPHLRDLGDGFPFVALVQWRNNTRHQHVIPVSADVAIPVLPIGCSLNFMAKLGPERPFRESLQE